MTKENAKNVVFDWNAVNDAMKNVYTCRTQLRSDAAIEIRNRPAFRIA